MTTQQLYDVWWTEEAAGEQRMEDEHLDHWRKIVRYVEETDLQERDILDFGCNQGGFLRYLYGERPYRHGVGVDLARRSIEIADKRKGNLPIRYEATAEPEKYRHRFDLAFSISVIYLITDLQEHARKLRLALRPGGVYYATYSDYAGNPSLPSIRDTINRYGALPMNEHTLDAISQAFRNEGFQVGIRRMQPEGYVQLRPEERWFERVADRLLYEYEQAYIFRCVAPATPS